MPMQTRGGVPHVRRITATTTVERLQLPFYTQWLKLRNKGEAIVRVYFTAQDAADDENYVEIPVAAATDPHGEWEGPVETLSGRPAPMIGSEAANNLRVDAGSYLWFKAASGSQSVEMVAFQRRG